MGPNPGGQVQGQGEAQGWGQGPGCAHGHTARVRVRGREGRTQPPLPCAGNSTAPLTTLVGVMWCALSSCCWTIQSIGMIALCFPCSVSGYLPHAPAGRRGSRGGGASFRVGEAHFDSVKAIFSSLSSENSKGVSAELISVSWCLNGPASFGAVAWSHRGLAVPVSSPRRHAGEGREGSPLVGGRWAHLQAPAEPRSAPPPP